MEKFEKIKSLLSSLTLGDSIISVYEPNDDDHYDLEEEGFDWYITCSFPPPVEITDAEGHYLDHYTPFENTKWLILDASKCIFEDSYNDGNDRFHEIVIPYNHNNQEILDFVIKALEEGLEEVYRMDNQKFEEFRLTV